MPPTLADAGDDLDGFRVRSSQTAADVLRQLGRGEHGVAVVVDESDQALGAVTDGDLRRAVLAARRMDAPITEFMSDRIPMVSALTPEDQVSDLLHGHRLRAVPVVEGGELVGMRSLRRLPQEYGPRTAVIMAGGRGSRLRPVTDTVPKPLLKVGSTSIVERLLAAFTDAGVDEVYLAVNYLAEVFEQRLGTGDHLGTAIRYLREEDAMGTAGALSLLPRVDRGPILVTNGDIVTTLNFSRLFDFHWRNRAAITVAGVEYRSPIPYGVLRNAEHHLLSIEEKPERRDLCSAGVYVLAPEVLRLLPPKEALGMPELIALALAEGMAVNVFPIVESWYDIGDAAQLERVLLRCAIGDED